MHFGGSHILSTSGSLSPLDNSAAGALDQLRGHISNGNTVDYQELPYLLCFIPSLKSEFNGDRMPRRRIRPEDRQRAIKACIPCKTSKKRCDSRLPCATCVKRDCEFSCVYLQARPSSARTLSSIQPQVPIVVSETFAARSIESISFSSNHFRYILDGPSLQEITLTMNNNDADGTAIDDYQTDDEPRYECQEDYVSNKAPEETLALPRSRLMLNAKGEKGNKKVL